MRVLRGDQIRDTTHIGFVKVTSSHSALDTIKKLTVAIQFFLFKLFHGIRYIFLWNPKKEVLTYTILFSLQNRNSFRFSHKIYSLPLFFFIFDHVKINLLLP